LSEIETANVLLIGYNRPELIEKRLVELAKLDLSRLHVSIDGSTFMNNESHKRVLQEMSNSLSGKFEFSFHIHETNLGLTPHITRAITNFLIDSESVIIIEDDISLNDVTIRSLTYGLRELKRTNRKGTVGAFSPLHLSSFFSKYNCFVESKYFLCWGWAISKESWAEYESKVELKNVHNDLVDSRSWLSLSQNQRDVWIKRFEKVSKNPLFTWDFQMQYATFKNDMIHLLPLGALTVNEGFSDQRATHTQNSKPKWMSNMALSTHQVTKSTKSKILARAFNLILSLTVVGDRATWIKGLSRFSKLIVPTGQREY
jgi:hypothetical protein